MNQYWCPMELRMWHQQGAKIESEEVKRQVSCWVLVLYDWAKLLVHFELLCLWRWLFKGQAPRSELRWRLYFPCSLKQAIVGTIKRGAFLPTTINTNTKYKHKYYIMGKVKRGMFLPTTPFIIWIYPIYCYRSGLLWERICVVLFFENHCNAHISNWWYYCGNN